MTKEPVENSSGYILFPSEEHIYRWLEGEFLKQFHTVKKQFAFAPSCIIDYYAQDQQGRHVLIEVKNWFVKIKDMQQIMKYIVHATEIYGPANFRFVLVCGGIEKERRELLEGPRALGVEVFLTKDIEEGRL